MKFSFCLDYSPTFPVYSMRLLPAVLGSLVVPLVYQIAVELRLSRWVALLAGLCVVFGKSHSHFLPLSYPMFRNNKILYGSSMKNSVHGVVLKDVLKNIGDM